MVVFHLQGYHPGMALHAALVTFADGKRKGIVAWTAASLTRENAGERLEKRGVDDIAAEAGLKQDGVDAYGL